MTRYNKSTRNRLSNTPALNRRRNRNKIYRAVGYGLGAGALAGAGLALRHKGIRRHIMAKLRGGGSSKASTMNMSSLETPQFARDHISEVMGVLKAKGYTPKDLGKLKIGVVGTGGTGKSSLALALQERAPNLKHLNLDSHISTDLGSIGTADITGALKQKGGISPGTISDQAQLLHGADPGKFDLIIKVKRDPGEITQSLYDRGHYGFVADYTDIRKAQTLVDDAFNMSGGTKFKVNSNIEISVNPSSAGANVQRRESAKRLGFDMRKFDKLSQRDQLISISEGALQKGNSWRSRISSGTLERDAAGASVAGLGGVYYGQND